MSQVGGKVTVFHLDNSAGVLTNISAYIDSMEFPETVPALKGTTYGKASDVYNAQGIANRTLTISGPYDTVIAAHLRSVINNGVTKSLAFGPAGSTAGALKITGECWVTAFRSSHPHDGLATYSADIQVTDDVTDGVWA